MSAVRRTSGNHSGDRTQTGQPANPVQTISALAASTASLDRTVETMHYRRRFGRPTATFNGARDWAPVSPIGYQADTTRLSSWPTNL